MFHGTVRMVFDAPDQASVRPVMTHFFYMDPADTPRVKWWVGAVGPVAF